MAQIPTCPSLKGLNINDDIPQEKQIEKLKCGKEA
jgi:hypothetical protein